jgi:hypothetical protein
MAEEKTYSFWCCDSYDGWGFDIKASSFEEAIKKAERGSSRSTWHSITDGIETREFNEHFKPSHEALERLYHDVLVGRDTLHAILNNHRETWVENLEKTPAREAQKKLIDDLLAPITKEAEEWRKKNRI